MGKCIKHERCPKCAALGKDRSGNNLGIYEDGSSYCFSCGYYEHGELEKKLEKKIVKHEEEQEIIRLPFDSDTALPHEALTFLSQFELNQEDVVRQKLMWSEKQRRLLFPICSKEGTLVAWTGRYIPRQEKEEKELDKALKDIYNYKHIINNNIIYNKEYSKHSKWYSKGINKDLFYVINTNNHNNNTIFVVEDIISAIKVGKYFPCLCLFGSHINDTVRYRLAMLYRHVILWLDADKQKEAFIFAQQLRDIGSKCISYKSSYDPKDYTRVWLEARINNASTIVTHT